MKTSTELKQETKNFIANQYDSIWISQLKAWARKFYLAGENVDESWHQEIKNECYKINREAKPL